MLVAPNIALSSQVDLLNISQKNLRVQMICFAHSESTMYSASADERTIMLCFLDFQIIGALFTQMINPVLDVLDSLHPAQSAST